MAKKKTAAKLSLNVPAVKLADVAALLRLPPGVKDEKVASGGKKLKVISIVDLPEADFIGDIKDSITLSKEKYDSIKKYFIQPFDVLMSIQGTVGRAGIVPEKFSGTWIANISLLAVRFEENSKDNSMAFIELLKSQYGRQVIHKLEKGTTIKRINVKEFARTQIPELTLDVKKQSKAVFDKEVKALEKINALRDSLEAIRMEYLAGN